MVNKNKRPRSINSLKPCGLTEPRSKPRPKRLHIPWFLEGRPSSRWKYISRHWEWPPTKKWKMKKRPTCVSQSWKILTRIDSQPKKFRIIPTRDFQCICVSQSWKILTRIDSQPKKFGIIPTRDVQCIQQMRSTPTISKWQSSFVDTNPYDQWKKNEKLERKLNAHS